MGGGDKIFGLLEFSGDRFEDEGMPVAALVELRRFEVLIEEVAVALYKREHTGRERVARGFRASFDLRVTDFKEGCVQAVLSRPESGNTKLDISRDDYFDQARDLVFNEIKAFSSSQTFSKSFPAIARPRLAVLGRGLRDNEVIGLTNGYDSGLAELTGELRAVLMETVEDTPSSVETVIYGQISGLESRPHQFTFFLSEEQRSIKGEFGKHDLWHDLNTYFGYRDRAPMVALSVIVRLTPTGEMDFIEDVFQVSEAIPADLASQIAEIEALEDAWFDGEGVKIAKNVLDRVEQLVQVISMSKKPKVSIFPRPDGGVQLEWAEDDFELDVMPDGTEIGFAFAEERDDDGERAFPSSTSPEYVVSWLLGEENV